MSKNHQNWHSIWRADRKLHASYDGVIKYCPGSTRHKKISDALVEDDFWCHARIDTAMN
ncbi:hypothetical protein AUR04nite_34450 [Glutamicibacter uratoxydans]|uniref:Uncharacterized protein n=1 Tax=Glutamicibacter uratoxydans TaxID=43667 RepID=A0A4Y4DTB9_GLUUR|nr:hypothetical protein AUR04nite_34450 [Glutamicibacter uratoxydans]